MFTGHAPGFLPHAVRVLAHRTLLARRLLRVRHHLQRVDRALRRGRGTMLSQGTGMHVSSELLWTTTGVHGRVDWHADPYPVLVVAHELLNKARHIAHDVVSHDGGTSRAPKPIGEQGLQKVE